MYNSAPCVSQCDRRHGRDCVLVLCGAAYAVRLCVRHFAAELLARDGRAALLCTELAALATLQPGAVRNEAAAITYLLLKYTAA